jgi:hypothetical protein
MSIQNTNIYKKLAIQVSLNGLSFCCFDTLNGTITSFKELQFDRFYKDIKIEALFANAFEEFEELQAKYDEV